MSRAVEAGERLPYFKLSGGGNDFVALVDPAEEPTAELIRTVCRRGLSLGADGLFVLRRSRSGARMDHFNADGGSAELCLNGARCAVRLAAHLGWGEEIALETGAGVLRGWDVSTVETRLEVSPPEPPAPLTVDRAGTLVEGWSVRVGVPHYVLLWPEGLSSAPVVELGAALRADPVFGAEGTNVNFVRFTDDRSFEIRSFERGVEAETLACGTGVMAATAVGRLLGRLRLPVAASTLGGFVLEVAESGDGDAWTLGGDARILARGEIDPAAYRIPAPQTWSQSS